MATATASSNTSTRVLTSVHVVVRDKHGALAAGLVPELIAAFADHSVRWDVARAACAGHRHLLDRLGAADAPISERQNDWAMRVAADRGDLYVLRWLSAYRPHHRVSTNVMDSAAFAGHLHVIEWLHAHRSEGCTTRAMDSAAARGHLRVVQWLHGNRSEGCSKAAMDTAAAGGHLQVLQWLAAHRAEGCSSIALNFAVFNGHLRVAQWLREHHVERQPAARTLSKREQRQQTALVL